MFLCAYVVKNLHSIKSRFLALHETLPLWKDPSDPEGFFDFIRYAIPHRICIQSIEKQCVTNCMITEFPVWHPLWLFVGITNFLITHVYRFVNRSHRIFSFIVCRGLLGVAPAEQASARHFLHILLKLSIARLMGIAMLALGASLFGFFYWLVDYFDSL